jgi:outer membrane protein
MRSRTAVIVLLAFTAALPALAGESLTLRAAMARARGEGRETAAAKEREEAARQRVSMVKGYRLPSLSFQELFVRTDSPAEAFAFKLNQERFSFQDFMVNDPNNPKPLNTALSRFELAMPLYTGGELSGRIGQAEAAARSSAMTTRWTGEQAALAAAEAYVTVDQAVEYLDLLRHSRDTVTAHVALARDYAAQGMLVRSEVLRAEVELARVDDLVVQAEGNVRVAKANLAFRLASPAGTEWELEPLAQPTVLPGDLQSWIDRARSRPDLEAAREQLKAGELEDKVRRAALLPKVAIVGRADYYDDILFGSHGRSTTAMAVASINLFAGGSDRAARAAARHELNAGQADVARFEEGVALEVRQAWEEATTARLRHATALQSLKAADEAERTTVERFRAGVAKTLDVLDVATARREAQTRELMARTEAQISAIRLAVKAGARAEEVLP